MDVVLGSQGQGPTRVRVGPVCGASGRRAQEVGSDGGEERLGPGGGAVESETPRDPPVAASYEARVAPVGPGRPHRSESDYDCGTPAPYPAGRVPGGRARNVFLAGEVAGMALEGPPGSGFRSRYRGGTVTHFF